LPVDWNSKMSMNLWYFALLRAGAP
jgi:hypothetical protein